MNHPAGGARHGRDECDCLAGKVMPDAFRVRGALLAFIELKSLPPCIARLAALAECGMSLGEATEDLGFPVGVAKTAEDIKRLPVVAQGLGGVAGVMGDVAQAVERGSDGFAVAMAAVQDQSGVAVIPCLLVVAEPRVIPAHIAAHAGLHHRVVKVLVEGQRVRCVGQGTLIIPLVFPQLGESAVGVSLAAKITILLGQGEALTEVVQGFFVAIR